MKIAVGSDSVRHVGDVVVRHSACAVAEKVATAPSTEPHRVAFHRKVDELDAHYRRRPPAEP